MSTARPNAPTLLPGEASTLLTVIGGLFFSSGALVLIALILVVGGKLLGVAELSEVSLPILGVGLVAALGAGYCWAGVLVYQARRRGAQVALGLIALSVIQSLGQQSAATWVDLLIPGLTAIALLLTWPHLSAEGRDLSRPTSIRAGAG